MSETLALAKLLISKSSVTPDDKGCQALMIDRLNKIGFTVQVLKFGEVDNFWAVRGDSGPVLLLRAILMWFLPVMNLCGKLTLLHRQ